MTRTPRRRAVATAAFVTAVLVAAAVITACGATNGTSGTDGTGGRGVSSPRASTTGSRAPAAGPRIAIAEPLAHAPRAGTRSSVRVRPPAVPTRSRTGRRTADARDAARTFLRALLESERGRRGPGIEAAFGRSATPALAAELIAIPARRPPGRAWPPKARIRKLSVIGPSAGRIKAIALLVRGGEPSSLELLLRRIDGRWRVTEFR